MSKADKGARTEREARDILLGHGYYVVKSGGSRGAVDLVAIRPHLVLFVQVKCGPGRLRPTEWNQLLSIARLYGAVPVLAERVDRKPMAWYRLEGAKVEGGRGRQPLGQFDPAWFTNPDPALVGDPLAL
jgi:Holliday junction resolvase